jgi:hypothetical protein
MIVRIPDVQMSVRLTSVSRGREQQLIQKNGGAKRDGGTSGDDINGISPKNPKRDKYIQVAHKEFDKR